MVPYLALRLRGGQFAIAMWVIAETFWLVVVQFESLGGGTGKSLTTLNLYAPADRQAYTYWLALVTMAALLVGLGAILRGRLGTALQSIRDDEVGAGSLGVRTTRGKRLIFLFSALGCGGRRRADRRELAALQPDSIFGVQWTAYMIFWVLIGGLGTYDGAIIGAVVFFVIQETFSDQGSWYLIGLGLLAIAMTIAAPRGIWGTLQGRTGLRLMSVGSRLRGLPEAAPSAAGAEAPVSPGPSADGCDLGKPGRGMNDACDHAETSVTDKPNLCARFENGAHSPLGFLDCRSTALRHPRQPLIYFPPMLNRPRSAHRG